MNRVQIITYSIVAVVILGGLLLAWFSGRKSRNTIAMTDITITFEPPPQHGWWRRKVWSKTQRVVSLWNKVAGPRAKKIMKDPVFISFLVLHSIIFLVAVLSTGTLGVPGWWIISLTLAICHGVAGLTTVSEKEKGALILWGKILKEVESGPVFRPWPMRLTLVAKTSIKVDFGTLQNDVDKENRWRSLIDPSWYVMDTDIRTNWGDIKSYRGTLTDKQREAYRDDPYARRITTDPRFYAMLRVKSLRALIGETGTLEEAIKRIQDVCITAMAEYAGGTFLALANENIQFISDILMKRVQYLIGDPEGNAWAVENGKPEMPSWGIDLLDVKVRDLGVPHRTNSAMVDRSESIAKADGEALAAIRKSEGEKTRLINEGDAAAHVTNVTSKADEQRLKRVGRGEAAAFAAKARVAATRGGATIIQAEALEAGLKHGKAVIIPSGSGIGEVMSALLSGQAALKAAGDSTPPPSPPTPPKA